MINKERVLIRAGITAIILPFIITLLLIIIPSKSPIEGVININLSLFLPFVIIGIFLIALSFRYRTKENSKVETSDKGGFSFTSFIGSFIKVIGIIIILLPFILLLLGILGMGMFSGSASMGLGIFTGILFLSILIPCIFVGAVFIILGIVIKRNVKSVVQVENVSEEKKETKTEDESLKVLKMRYAKGEISRKDFEQKKKDLEEK
jgi:uncharacterized membrane protein